MTPEELKKLAGVDIPVDSPDISPEANSKRASELREEEHRRGLKPGDPEWMELWFGSSSSLNMPTGFRGRK